MIAVELHAVTDGKKPIEKLAEIILSVSDIVDYIHIREKNKTARDIVYLVELLLEKGVRKRKLVINDRLDVALITGIENVHLPISGLPVNKVKSRFPNMRVGVSVHSLEEAFIAKEAGADYCFFGNVFETNSKKGLPGKGVVLLEDIVQEMTVPVIAIGGITLDNMEKVLETNVKGIAVMSYIFSSIDPARDAKLLKSKMLGE